ncbi:MAG: aminodeoxychorismate synthase component I [Opitutus sp.]|nr:aminodeoxychorismate synthase component I [Opitutus sp.]MCS6245894.1 aminodeoxychorismate synthase component I [Opitutus sp.]MCS6275470.1 aminodeoxychorismate synthase component I [Opitutus sp.]MCS6276027.1 aminodeoxychorismate synthase component I [Opitutus sp.]MCS6301122.1 aminodeoxychorismate synthase component I [Opitutus sp.]
MQTAYLGLGSNLGDRHAHLANALGRLAAAPEVRIARVSSVYETTALCLPGQAAQPDYLNLVVELETTLEPHGLLDLCLAIEEQLGRVRRERWGARTIDLDVLLYGATELCADERLTLPHPRLCERAFVLAPLGELAPELRVRGKTVSAHLARADATGIAVRPEWALSPPILLEEVKLPGAPHEFFAQVESIDHAFFLDSGRSTGGLGAYSFIGFAPFFIYRAQEGATAPLNELREVLKKYSRPARKTNTTGYFVAGGGAVAAAGSEEAKVAPMLPFTGGAVGFLSYELCAQLEKISRHRPDDLPAVPDCEFGFYDGIIAHEHATDRTWLVASPVHTSTASSILARLRAAIESQPSPPSQPEPKCHLLGDTHDDTAAARPPTTAPSLPVANFDFAGYTAAIGRIKAYIASGDVYQVNLTQRFATPLPCPPYALYQRLRERSPAPFAAYLSFGPVQVVSSSPERFLTVRGRHVETRPIKGTRPRSANPVEDARLAAELLASEKDRAELLMIVDLERNDLGRVCAYGSVQVEKLWQLESHPTVHHLVATVSGTLRPEIDVIDCVAACFPGGSITGAPKIRAMEIIDELEPHRRHLYTGAIGYLGFDGNADLNIAIRTLTCVGGQAYYHVGGGIVWDSNPSAEYQETLDKGRAMHEALTQV